MWSNLVNQASNLASQAAAQASNISEQIQKEIETSIEQSKAQQESDNQNNNKPSENPVDPMSGTCPSLQSGDATNANSNSKNKDENNQNTSTIDPTLNPETVEKMTKQADEVADKIINFASNWAGKAMTVASDVTQLTQDKIKEAQSSELATNLKAQTKIVTQQALEITTKVGDQVTNQVGQINEIIENKTIIGDFNKHQKQQIEDNLATVSEVNGCPWEGYEDFEILKEQVLNLSKDKRTFVRNPPAGVTFNFEYQKSAKQAMAMLSEDENLKKMRFELVPKQMKEETFWRNYFYRVSLIKQSFNLKQMSKSTNSLKTTSSNPDENTAKTETTIPMTDLKNSRKNSKEVESQQEDHHHDEQFVSTDFNNDLTADDLEAEMKALGMDGNEASAANNNDDEDWEKELNQELAEYEVVDENEADGADTQDTSEWEKEVNDMLG